MRDGASEPRRGRLWYLLLLLPCLFLLWPPLYAKAEPSLLGFPFFYWWQFLWVPISALLTWIVHVKTRDKRDE